MNRSCGFEAHLKLEGNNFCAGQDIWNPNQLLVMIVVVLACGARPKVASCLLIKITNSVA